MSQRCFVSAARAENLPGEAMRLAPMRSRTQRRACTTGRVSPTMRDSHGRAANPADFRPIRPGIGEKALHLQAARADAGLKNRPMLRRVPASRFHHPPAADPLPAGAPSYAPFGRIPPPRRGVPSWVTPERARLPSHVKGETPPGLLQRLGKRPSGAATFHFPREAGSAIRGSTRRKPLSRWAFLMGGAGLEPATPCV